MYLYGFLNIQFNSKFWQYNSDYYINYDYLMFDDNYNTEGDRSIIYRYNGDNDSILRCNYEAIFNYFKFNSNDKLRLYYLCG